MIKQQTFVKLPNSEGKIELTYLTDNIINARKEEFTWQLQQWTPRPALIDKSGGGSRLYVGQTYNPKYFDLVNDGWTHDHCIICYQTVSDWKETQVTADKREYTDGNNNWICKNCYTNFIKPKDYQKVLDGLKRVNK